MLKKIKTYLLLLFKSPPSIPAQVRFTTVSPIMEFPLSIIDDIDYSAVESPVFISEDPDKPFLFILDDIIETFLLYSIDFKNIKRLHGMTTEEDYNIVQCFGDKAGFIAHKYIVLENGRVDYAILDITLGYIVKLANGEFIEHDGIDIAIKILERNPAAKILFSTAHTMRRRDPTIAVYIDKFYHATGRNIDECYMNKNSNRVERIYELLYGDTNVTN